MKFVKVTFVFCNLICECFVSHPTMNLRLLPGVTKQFPKVNNLPHSIVLSDTEAKTQFELNK